MEQSDHSWRGIYVLGGLFTSFVLFITLLDIVAGFATGGDLTQLPQTARDRFIQLQDSPFLGLYNLDLLNLISQVLMIPVFFAMYGTLRRQTRGEALFALFVFLIGTAVFINANPALPMVELSERWISTNNEVIRNLYVAAGEGILARGVHGSTGAFMGFFLIVAAGILMAWAMAQTRVYNQKTILFGLLGNGLLLIYIVLVTFIPAVGAFAFIVALPGGLLMLVWLSMVCLRLFKMGRSKPGRPQPASSK